MNKGLTELTKVKLTKLKIREVEAELDLDIFRSVNSNMNNIRVNTYTHLIQELEKTGFF